MKTIRVKGDHMARVHARLTRLGRFPMWVVYLPITREYPYRWVARCHVSVPTAKPTRWVLTHDTLPALRRMLPPGLARLDRNEADEDEIVETWV